MKRITGLALLLATGLLIGIGNTASAEPAKKTYKPPMSQRIVKWVWDKGEYVYEGDWVPEFICKKDPDRQIENPDAYEKPGDYRGESRPGYRARPTPQSVAFYRYVMEKAGRGEDINVSEATIIQKMIQNRTWPEAPKVTDQDRGALDWANKQGEFEDSSVFTDPIGWTRKKNADIIYEQMTKAGKTEEDMTPSEGIEKFRKYWQSKTPEEKKNLPLGRWMKGYMTRKGYDMRSDEERADDDAYVAEQEEKQKRQEAEAAKEESERKAEEEVKKEAERQKGWFKDKWAEEDRRIAVKEAKERLKKKGEEVRQDGEPSDEAVTPDDEVKPDDQPDDTDTPKDDEIKTDDEVKPDDEDVPPDDEVKPDDEDVPPDDEVKPDDETKPEDEIAPPERDRDRKTKDDEVNPDEEGETVVEPEAETEDEPEVEPEDRPEAGDVEDNPNGSTTTTKGYVEGEDGSRITLTETRNPDGSVNTTTTETDADGNIISETSYGESGEGRTTRPDNDLRNAEPDSDVEVDAETAAGGVNTADSYGSDLSAEQQQRSADSSSIMVDNTQMEESSNVGNQQTRDARTTRDSGGTDAQITADASRRKTNKSDRENSWSTALGDGVESGITQGGKSFGKSFGGAASDAAVGTIFGSKKDESSSEGTSATAAAPATPKKKPKKKPSASSSGSRSGGSSDPIGVTGTRSNNDGTVTIRYGCGYSWTGKPPGPSRCPICSRETISTESNSSSSDDKPPTTTKPPQNRRPSSGGGYTTTISGSV